MTDKQRVSNWDILEGMKNPAPLSWAWFGAVRLERKPLTCEDNHRLLKYHTHNLQRPASHYLDPPPLPPEDLEPIPDKPVSIYRCFQLETYIFLLFFFYRSVNTFFHKLAWNVMFKISVNKCIHLPLHDHLVPKLFCMHKVKVRQI